MINENIMSEYTAEDYISFIESGRRDKISPAGLTIIAEKFRELESKSTRGKGYQPKDTLDTSNPPSETDFDYWKAAYDFSEEICPSKMIEHEYSKYINSKNFSFNEILLFRFSLSEAFRFKVTCAELMRKSR